MDQTIKYRTEISIETHEIKTIRIRGGHQGVCPVCGSNQSPVQEIQASCLTEHDGIVPTKQEHKNGTQR